MTYLDVHLFLTLPVLGALAVAEAVARRGGPQPSLGPLAGLVVLAVVYTTPWDNYLVWRGVWGYGEGRVLGTWGWVPVEEYAFFVLQTLSVGLWTRRVRSAPAGAASVWPARLGVALGVLATALGAALWAGGGRGLYLGLILVWAGPVVAVQWGLGGAALWADRRALALAAGVPALVFCVVDRIAIGAGVWRIADATRTGAEVAGLPVEEALFFGVTSLFVAQTLLVLRAWRGRLAPRRWAQPATA